MVANDHKCWKFLQIYRRKLLKNLGVQVQETSTTEPYVQRRSGENAEYQRTEVT